MTPSSPTLGIGILSWRAHDTLRHSLESYTACAGFLDLFDKRVIYFSDISDADRALAAQYGWTAVGGPNAGIAAGMKNLAHALGTDYVLLLQNDNPIVEPAAFAHAHIRAAITLMQNGQAHMARMRHRWHVGEGFSDVIKYLRYFPALYIAPDFSWEQAGIDARRTGDNWRKKLRRFARPFASHRMAGRSVFIEQFPDHIHPHLVSRTVSTTDADDFLIIDSAVLPFSDQCVLAPRRFFLDVLMDYVDKHPKKRTLNGFQVAEICLNTRWWRRQHFKVLQGRGVFTHRRYDGSFRPEHHAYEKPST
jgi:hypothetical protein